jgi:hypothetical protein
MSDRKPEKEAPMACSLCMKEMPHDLAHTLEGPDYVHHFCGLECYRKWQERQAAEDAKQG